MMGQKPVGALMDGSSGFRLLETARVDEDGTVFLLERHLERLYGAARYFNFPCDIAQLRQVIQQGVADEPRRPARMRLLLSSRGECELQFHPLQSGEPHKYVRLSSVKVDSGDPFIRHKTTHRRVYEQARLGHPADSDVILVNERGELTESSIANIALWRGGRWVTPQASCGLLPGTLRAELLENGDLVEGILTADELVAGEQIRCFNSVRGVYDLCLVA
jgi:branched-subunit amino acid aminotransferase/4-amino-4-deoxychorismate lyase